MAQSLEIVPPRLLPPEVGVDAHVPWSAQERLLFAVGDVFLGLRIPVAFGRAEIDEV